MLTHGTQVETNLEPRALLTFLKTIETAVGRTETFRNGPRAIDLDIVAYDSIVLDTRPEALRKRLDNLKGELVVPHPRLTEREFVLRPLAECVLCLPLCRSLTQPCLA